MPADGLEIREPFKPNEEARAAAKGPTTYQGSLGDCQDTFARGMLLPTKKAWSRHSAESPRPLF